MKTDPVRRLASAALLRIEGGAPLASAVDEALARHEAHARRGARGKPVEPSEHDQKNRRAAALLTELILGTLRWRGRYDRLIAAFCPRRPPRKLRMLVLLRLALHQLIGCDGIPAYAAIHQAGELCRETISPRQVGFVNGFLQSVRRYLERAGLPAEQAIRPLFPDAQADPIGFLAEYWSHPRWLVERWYRQLGFRHSEQICRYNNVPPRTALHVLATADFAAVRQRLAQKGFDTRRCEGFARALVLTERHAQHDLDAMLAAFPELIVQDPAVQAATDWLAGGARGWLLDMCAAPGGKTFHLRARWPQPTRLVAMDRDRERLAKLQATAKRLGQGRPFVVLANGEQPPFAPETFDTILLDGPCSGTGVLRHHPEGRWRLEPESPARHGRALLALARQAVTLLSPGGRLLYATCSLEPDENEQVIAALRREYETLEPDPVPVVAGDDDAPATYQRCWYPSAEGTDGFFAARLRMKGSSV